MATVGRASTLQEIKNATYETMYFIVRKKFFNAFSKVQVYLSCAFILRLVFDKHYKVWYEDVNDVVELILSIHNGPLFMLDFPLAYVGWTISTVLLGILLVTGTYIGYELAHSSLDRMWVVTAFRAMLGFSLMFYFMPLQAWLAWVRCDYFEGILGESDALQNIELKDTDTDKPFVCYDSSDTQRTVFSVLAIVFSVIWSGIVLVGAHVHINDPRSWSLLARPNCWCEVIDYSTGISLLFLQTFFSEFPAFLAIMFVLLRGFLTFFTIKIQPYYNAFMTDFKAALFMAQTFAGIMFFIASVIDDALDSKTRLALTIIALAGFPLIAAVGYMISAKYRSIVLTRAKEQYQAVLEGVKDSSSKRTGADTTGILTGNDQEGAIHEGMSEAVKLTEENETLKNHVWETIDQEYVPGVTMSVWSWFQAVHAEVKTRFLQDKKCNKLPDDVTLSIAENIFLKSLVANPQSAYLALQYIVFIASYRENSGMASKCLEDRVATRMKVNLGLAFSIFRKRKDIDRLKRSAEDDQHGGGGDTDAIGYEEIQRMEKEATIAHLRCEIEMENVWSHMSAQLSVDSKDQASRAQIRSQRMELLERVAAAENRAEDAYIYVLERYDQAVKVFRDYARFLEGVKGDRKTARQMIQRAEDLDKTAKNDESKSQGSESRNSRSSEDKTAIIKRQKKLSSVGWLKIKLRVASFILLAAITGVFVDYMVAILDYENTLLNLNESGARRFYSQYAAMDVREILVDAKLNRSHAFELGKAKIRTQMDRFLNLHISLSHRHRTTYKELKDFYSMPQAEQVVKVPNPKTHSWTDRWRSMAVSGTDAPFRVIAEAYLASTMPMYHFTAFDKTRPSSAPEVAFLLENIDMVARGLDDATALYQLEASYSAEKMRAIFIALSVVSAVIEIVLVIFIFRKAVTNAFFSLGEEIDSLSNPQNVSAAAIEEKIRRIKAGKVKSRHTVRQGTRKDRDADSASDSDLGSDEDEHERLSADMQEAINADEDMKVMSVSQQQLLMSLFYYMCLVFVCACLVALCGLCMYVINNAERSAAEINNGSRRYWLGMRLKYFASELIWNGPDGQAQGSDLTNGIVQTLNSIMTIQCALARTAESLLSVHYGMIYGKAQGWVNLPEERGFRQGGVREWGSKGSVDECSPFTWNKEHFDKSIDTSGSIARYKPLDQTYFERNCLTQLKTEDVPSNAYIMTNERMRFFSKRFDNGIDKCAMLHARCRTLSFEQYDALPESPCLHYEGNVCDEWDTDAPGKQRRVNARSHLLNTAKEIYSDPCFGKEYPNHCHTRTEEFLPECACDDGSARDIHCEDQIATQGLHNYALYLTEQALKLASKNEAELVRNNEEYNNIRAYDNIEWEMGNLKAVLLHQHEAIIDMHMTSTLTQILYAFLIIVILAQYFFLGRRIENLMIKHDQVRGIVRRFIKAAQDIQTSVVEKGESKESLLAKKDDYDSEGDSEIDSADEN